MLPVGVAGFDAEVGVVLTEGGGTPRVPKGKYGESGGYVAPSTLALLLPPPPPPPPPPGPPPGPPAVGPYALPLYV